MVLIFGCERKWHPKFRTLKFSNIQHTDSEIHYVIVNEKKNMERYGYSEYQIEKYKIRAVSEVGYKGRFKFEYADA